MVFTEIDTAGLLPEHRFEWWRGIVEQGVAPTRISSDCGPDFAGRAGFLTLGPAQVTTMAFSPITSERPAHLVRRSDPETFELTLILEGSMHVSQGRSETHLGAGDFAMWTSSCPYSGRAIGSPEGGVSRAIILHLPHSLVPLPDKRVEELLAHRMPAASGFGRVLAQYLRSVVQEASALDEAGFANGSVRQASTWRRGSWPSGSVRRSDSPPRRGTSSCWPPSTRSSTTTSPTRSST